MFVAMIVPSAVFAEDVVVLKSGAKQSGRIVSQDNNVVVLEMQVGKRKVTRKFPRGVILSIMSDDAGGKPSGSGSSAPAGSGANVPDDDPADGVAPMNPLAKSRRSRGSSSAGRFDVSQIRKIAQQAQDDLRSSCEDREILARFETVNEELTELTNEQGKLNADIKHNEDLDGGRSARIEDHRVSQ
jgi:hypothetical protein